MAQSKCFQLEIFFWYNGFKFYFKKISEISLNKIKKVFKIPQNVEFFQKKKTVEKAL